MKLRNGICLLLAAFIWGTAFVAQSVGNNYMGPITFQASRSVLAIVVLAPLVLVRRNARMKREEAGDTNVPHYDLRRTICGGIVTGVFLTSASICQQIGLVKTDVGKSGFITALYIVLVPVIAFILYRQSNIRIWVSVIIAACGLYFLCVTGSFSIAPYDLVLVLCACLFAIQITCVDHFSKTIDSVELSLGQFITSAVIATVIAVAVEHPDMSSILNGWFPVFYAGVFSSGIAYTLQIVGQKGQNPTIASLLMSLESVISVLAGWALLGQILSKREGIGCLLMFAAIILAQLPDRKQERT